MKAIHYTSRALYDRKTFSVVLTMCMYFSLSAILFSVLPAEPHGRLAVNSGGTNPKSAAAVGSQSPVDALVECLEMEKDRDGRISCIMGIVSATGEEVPKVRQVLGSVISSTSEVDEVKYVAIQSLRQIGPGEDNRPAIRNVVEDASLSLQTRFHAAKLLLCEYNTVEGLEFLSEASGETLYITTWAGIQVLSARLDSPSVSTPEEWERLRDEGKELMIRALQKGDTKTRLLLYEALVWILPLQIEGRTVESIHINPSFLDLVRDLANKAEDPTVMEASRNVLDLLVNLTSTPEGRAELVDYMKNRMGPADALLQER